MAVQDLSILQFAVVIDGGYIVLYKGLSYKFIEGQIIITLNFE